MMALPSAFLAAVLSGAWDPIADMPTKRESGAMTLVGDGKLIPKRVAYLGGSAQGLHHHKGWANAGVGDIPFASAVLYDPSTQAWTRLPDMSMPRDSPAACAIGDVLYVFGGTAKFPVGTTNSMEYIQLGSLNPKWIVGPPLPGSNRTSPTAASLPDGAGCVIAGGFSSMQPTDFSYHKDAWFFDGTMYKRLPDMHFRRSNMGLVGTSSAVFAIGGSELYPAYYNASVLSYKKGSAASGAPEFADDWKAIKPLHRARSYPMASSIVDAASGEARLVVAGGMSLIPVFEPMASVETYSPEADQWTLFEQGSAGALPLAIGCGSAASLNATHMLIAGGLGPGVTGVEAFQHSL